MARVRLGTPKGSLEKETFALLERAWYKVYGTDRTYKPVLSDREIDLKVLRPQEIPLLVSEGVLDAGITGRDWIKETRAKVEVLLDLGYGEIKLVLAVPNTFPVKSLDELLKMFWNQGKPVRISTEYLNIASEYVMSCRSYKEASGDKDPLVITPWWKKGESEKVSIYLSFGATEAKPPEDADAIVDVVETGRTLEKNNLKALETIMDSSAVLIANPQSFANPERREKIYDILTLLKGVVDSGNKLHIFVNVREENLEELLAQLPALKRPTVSPLSEQGWYSINTVVEKGAFLRLIPTLRRLAQGLVVHEPQQILPLEEIARGESGR